MKKINIAFLGIAAALSAGGANAATATKIASQAYVDTSVANVSDTIDGKIDTKLDDYTPTSGLDAVIDTNITNSINTTGAAINTALGAKADASDVTALGETVDANTQSIGDINAKIGTEALTTTAQTIAGAINEIKDSVPTDEAFTEINGKISAMQITLDNTQPKLNEAQTAAVDSGITTELVTQIGSNTTAVTNLTTEVAGKANSATTLAGYGITDAYTQGQIDTKFNNTIPKPEGDCAAASGRCVLTINNAGDGLMWMDITPDTVTEPDR